MHFDLAQTPFSRFGSYFSIMTPPKPPAGGPGLYLRCHRARGVGMRDVFRLDLLTSGQVTPAGAVGSAEKLVLKGPGDSQLEICFDDGETLRLRGRGAGLRLDLEPGFSVAHPFEGGRWVVNARPALTRFMFEAMAGELRVEAPWGPDKCDHVRVDLLPDASGHLDAAIDAFQSTWVPRPRRAFDDCLASAQRDFESFLSTVPPAPAHLEEARRHAAYVNWSAVVPPLGFLKRPAMLMSKVVMDQVWSWDDCFNAMAHAAGQPQLAFDQLMVIVDHQDEFGSFPDAVNPSFKHYNFCKPPVLGWALDYMMKQSPDFFTRDRLLEIYEPLCRWSRWWLEHRTAPGEVLPYYLHGNDSGWDNSTMFDHGVPLVSPDLASFLAIQFAVIADIAGRLGKRGEARQWAQRSEQFVKALVDELYKDGQFTARRQSDGFVVRCRSLIPLIPLVLGKRLPEPVSRSLLAQLPAFHTPHGLATELTDSPFYTPDGYWRGPIWAPPTMLIFSGLRDLGETALAREIAKRFCATCARSGFAENFNALTGAALRDTAYTWTSSVFLLLAQSL